MSTSNGLEYLPYDALDGRPNVIVDGSATAGTVLCLSHWPGTPSPTDVQADLSAEMAFRYLRSFDRHGDARLVSNNHADQDGLVSIFALVDPATALEHEALLTDVAAAGDFGTYRHRDAARASMVISAYTDHQRSPVAAELAATDDPTGLLYTELLPRLVEMATHPERYEALWTDHALADRLRRQCAFVVDLAALAGYHGKPQQKAARRYVESGWAAAVATDAHSVEDVRTAAEGIAWIEKRLGARAVERLLDDGPRAILLGELPE